MDAYIFIYICYFPGRVPKMHNHICHKSRRSWSGCQGNHVKTLPQLEVFLLVSDAATVVRPWIEPCAEFRVRESVWIEYMCMLELVVPPGHMQKNWHPGVGGKLSKTILRV